MLQKMRWFKMVTSSTFEFWVVNLAYIYIIYIIYIYTVYRITSLRIVLMVCGPWLSHLGILKGNPKSSLHHKVHPRKLAWTSKIPIFERKFLFQNPSSLGFMLVFGGVKYVTIAKKMKEGYLLLIVSLFNPTVNLKPNSPALAAA